MSLSISGTLSAQPTAATTAAAAATRQTPTKPVSADTASVSQSAQVSQLSLQGQSPSQIAASLGIPVSSVDLDLGIATVASNSTAAGAAALTRSTSAA